MTMKLNKDLLNKSDIESILEPTLLWSNPSPNQGYSETSITLNYSAANYNYIVVEYKFHYSWTSQCEKIKYNVSTFTIDACNVASNELMSRIMTFTDSTHISIQDCKNYGVGTANDYLVPIAIYGTNIL